VSEQKILNLKVKGEPPIQAAPPLYSNFLAVSQVGTDIQFEFIFLDLNQVAAMIAQFKSGEITIVPEVEGKTVVKVVMPAATFVQLHEPFEKIFLAWKDIGVTPTAAEVQNEHRGSTTKVG